MYIRCALFVVIYVVFFLSTYSELEELLSFIESLKLELSRLQDLWNYKMERSELLCAIDEQLADVTNKHKLQRLAVIKFTQRLVVEGLQLSAKERELRSLRIVEGLTDDSLLVDDTTNVLVQPQQQGEEHASHSDTPLFSGNKDLLEGDQAINDDGMQDDGLLRDDYGLLTDISHDDDDMDRVWSSKYNGKSTSTLPSTYNPSIRKYLQQFRHQNLL